MLELLSRREFYIFDLDGTIADTSTLHAHAFSQVFREHGHRFHYPDYSGMSTRDVVHRFLSGIGESVDGKIVDRLAAEKQALVRELIQSDLVATPGVDGFISWCAAAGRRMGMVTSGSAGTVEVTLRRLGYIAVFDPVVTADDVDHGKPDPEGYRLALSLSGVEPAKAVVFEDADAGIAAATAAGIDCIDVRRHSWRELLDAVS